MTTWRDIHPHCFSFADVYDMAYEAVPDGGAMVEVGTFTGRSAAYMATKIRDGSKRLWFVAVDNFTGVGSTCTVTDVVKACGGSLLETWQKNIDACELQFFVTPVQCDSTVAASMYEDSSLDFVFIDASHLYARVKADILAWLPKVKPGGILAGHDYDKNHGDVVRAVKETLTPVEIMTHSWVYRV